MSRGICIPMGLATMACLQFGCGRTEPVVRGATDPTLESESWWSAPDNGAVRLTQHEQLGRNIADFSVHDDAGIVLYRSRPSSAEPQALFAAKLDGSAALKLSPETIEGSGVTVYRLTPDGTRVVFIAQVDPDVRELFSVDVDGSNLIQHTHSTFYGGGPTGFQITEDSADIAYVNYDDNITERRLYRVPCRGNSSEEVSLPLAVKQSVETLFLFWPGTRQLLFTFESARNNNPSDLGMVDIDNAALTTLSGPGAGNHGVTSTVVTIVDEQRVLYIDDDEANLGYGLYEVGIAGDNRIVRCGSAEGYVSNFSLSPDASQLLCRSKERPGEYTLLSRSDGSRIVLPALPGSATAPVSYLYGSKFSPDGSRLLAAASVPTVSPIIVSLPLASPDAWQQIAEFSSHWLTLDGAEIYGLYSKFSLSWADMKFSPDGSRIVFNDFGPSGEQIILGVVDLRSGVRREPIPSDSSGVVVRATDTLFMSASEDLLILANAQDTWHQEVFRWHAQIDRLVRISHSASMAGDVSQMTLLTDEQHLLYVSDDGGSDNFYLLELGP